MNKKRLISLLLMFGPILLINEVCLVVLLSSPLFAAAGPAMMVLLIPLFFVVLPLFIFGAPLFIIGLIVFLLSRKPNIETMISNEDQIGIIKKWNWGAAGLPYIWGPYYGFWQGLLGLIPVFNIAWFFIMGQRGNQWLQKKYAGNNEIINEQEKWTGFGVIFSASIIGSIIACAFLGTVLYYASQLVPQIPRIINDRMEFQKNIKNYSIKLLYPNGGEALALDSRERILWSGDFPADARVVISFYEDGTDPKNATVMYNTFASSTNSVFCVKCESSIKPGKNYRIKVELTHPGILGGSDVIASDESDAPFSIITNEVPNEAFFIKLLSPIGGEKWPIGSSQIIRWDGKYSDGATVDIWIDDKSEIAPNKTGAVLQGLASDNSYTWIVDDRIKSGRNYNVNIILYDKNNRIGSDESKGTISVN